MRKHLRCHKVVFNLAVSERYLNIMLQCIMLLLFNIWPIFSHCFFLKSKVVLFLEKIPKDLINNRLFILLHHYHKLFNLFAWSRDRLLEV